MCSKDALNRKRETLFRTTTKEAAKVTKLSVNQSDVRKYHTFANFRHFVNADSLTLTTDFESMPGFE